MKRLAPAMVMLTMLVGCPDGDGAGFTSGTSRDTGTPRDSGTFDETSGMGTQVGSEGFWGCPIERVDPLDGTTDVPAIGGSPQALTARLVGEWPLQIRDETGGEVTAATLGLVDLGSYLWVDVTDGAGCVDHLASEVSGTVARGSSTTAWSGFVGITDGAARLLVTADGASDTLAEVWGAPAYAPGVPATLRIDGTLDPARLDGAASWVDCDPLEVRCDTADPVAEVDGAR